MDWQHVDAASAADQCSRDILSTVDCDARFFLFEDLIRHHCGSEPRPGAILGKRYAKLKPLREALRTFEQHVQRSEPGFNIYTQLLVPLLQAVAAGEPPTLPNLDAGAKITLSAAQCHTVLANAFIGNCKGSLDLFAGGKDPVFLSNGKIAVQKMCCLLQYFYTCKQSAAFLQRDVVFDRQRGQPAVWEEVEAVTVSDGSLHLAEEASVCEVGGADVLVDFANEQYGYGQVTGSSATQEEILMVCYTEALVGMLLTPAPMATDEAFVIRGLRCFAATTGYQHTFRYVGDAPAEQNGVDILAIDAARVSGSAQCAQSELRRDLHKAIVGFSCCGEGSSTGLWGCGTYWGGHPVVKALLQLCAAAVTKVRLQFCVTLDRREEVFPLLQKLLEVCFGEDSQRQLSVGQILNAISSCDGNQWAGLEMSILDALAPDADCAGPCKKRQKL